MSVSEWECESEFEWERRECEENINHRSWCEGNKSNQKIMQKR